MCVLKAITNTFWGFRGLLLFASLAQLDTLIHYQYFPRCTRQIKHQLNDTEPDWSIALVAQPMIESGYSLTVRLSDP